MRQPDETRGRKQAWMRERQQKKHGGESPSWHAKQPAAVEVKQLTAAEEARAVQQQIEDLIQESERLKA
jgi:hypothetical protein